MKKLNKTYASGILAVLFGIWVIVESQGISEKLVNNEPGPKLFPYIAALGIIVCAVLSMIFDGPKEAKEEPKPYLDKDGWKRLGIILGELLVFALGMHFLGFPITGMVMCMVFILTLKREQKINRIFAAALSIGLTCLIYFGFTKGFRIPLPTGVLWEALGVTFPF